MPWSASRKSPGRAVAAPVNAPLHVAEQLALEQPLRQGGAVDRHEAAVGPLGEAVERAGHQLLAGAGLAQHQHRGLRGRHPRERLHHLDDRRAVAHQRRPRRRSSPAAARLGAAVPAHAGQPPASERARQRLAQRGEVVGLADEVVGARADRLACRGGVAEGGEHQHQRAGIPLAQHAQQIEPALLAASAGRSARRRTVPPRSTLASASSAESAGTTSYASRSSTSASSRQAASSSSTSSSRAWRGEVTVRSCASPRPAG